MEEVVTVLGPDGFHAALCGHDQGLVDGSRIEGFTFAEGWIQEVQALGGLEAKARYPLSSESSS